MPLVCSYRSSLDKGSFGPRRHRRGAGCLALVQVEDGDDKQWHAPYAEISLEHDPEARERGDISKKYRYEVDNKISQKKVLAGEEADGREDVIHCD